jgi:hypothetical protein
MVDPRRASDMNEAAARFADALAESYRIVYGQAAEAQERQARFAREFSERVLDHLKEQAESGRAASEQLADQARRQQEAGRELAHESVNAYVEFLDTAFSQYRGTLDQAQGRAQRAEANATKGFPIAGYDEMNVDEIREQLGDLTVEQLQEVKHYEERNKNRSTLIEEIDFRLTGSR